MGGNILTQMEQEQIKEAIRLVEKNTSSEIVVMVVPDCGPYPAATIWGAASLSFPLALLLTPATCAFFWFPPQNMWVFLTWFILLFTASFLGIQRSAVLRRLFIRDKEMENQVRETAQKNFFMQGLYRTRDETAVLIFISMLEQMVSILPDRGVNKKIPQAEWQSIVEVITSGIRETQAAQAIVDGVTEAGKRLMAHFPAATQDKEELENLVVKQS